MLFKNYFVSFLAAAVSASVIEKAFFVELAPSPSIRGRSTAPHADFHKRAEAALDYSVRHVFDDPSTYYGLSVNVNSAGSNDAVKRALQAIPGVVSVAEVQRVTIPITTNASLDPLLSFSNPPPLKSVRAGAANLASPLQMGGVDKLHALGIKGKGIKIGIIDTGVDYRHPALGGGFGPGYKIEGGWAFVADNGTSISDPDPLTTCYGGGHGTHVAGLVGMVPVEGQFDITGVAPEAAIYAYKALDCNGHGGSDNIAKAMQKALDDKVDIVSMSLSTGPQSWLNATDPLLAISNKLRAAGIAVIVAASNDASPGKYANNLYTNAEPSSIPGNIAVGSIAIKDFPLVYSAVDSLGATIKYASIYPLNFPQGADVILVENPCNDDDWNTALDTVQDINNTIITFRIDGVTCSYSDIIHWKSASKTPVTLMAFNSEEENLYYRTYVSPSQGYFGGSVQFTNVDNVDGDILAANYASAGGYGKYKLTFPSKEFQSTPAASGGYVDWYSSFGPTWHDYNLKPQLSAPGGHALATWPLGVLGGWCILSGTSMATPYASGSFALVKTQYPKASIDEIMNLLQTNADPIPWIYDNSILSATAQQGAGAINVYDAIFAKTSVSPGELKITDVTHTEYGTATITIRNKGDNSKTYTLSHEGAGYINYRLAYREINQQAKYGSAKFTQDSVTVAAGASTSVKVAVTPPNDVVAQSLPVFGGFIKISSDGESYSVPYIGPPYSLYNTPHIQVTTEGNILPQFQGHINGSTVVDEGFLEVDPHDGWGSVIPTPQWTTEARIDVLPADTTIEAAHYGFNRSDPLPEYKPSAQLPTSTIFGYPSFGTIRKDTALAWPGNLGVYRSDTIVTADSGTQYAVGDGDYRWFVSVLRWGGTSGVKEDYDTWLGPVIRFVNS